MIDIGANLCNDRFNEDIDSVLKRAFDSNLDTIILTTTSLESFHKNIEIITKHSQYKLLTTLGLHPHNAKDYELFFNSFDSLIKEPHVVSIGEFGLDYDRMISNKETQIFVMNEFMQRCTSYKLPLFLHERAAFNDFVCILKEHNVSNKKVVHCFTGNKEQLKAYLDLDCYIGITGWLTDEKRNHELKEALKYIPIDRLMIETDSPYLIPKNTPNQHKRNEPAFLYYIGLYLCAHVGKDFSQLMNCLNKNSREFFQI